jgi:hypothetical protein
MSNREELKKRRIDEDEYRSNKRRLSSTEGYLHEVLFFAIIACGADLSGEVLTKTEALATGHPLGPMNRRFEL